MYCQYSLVCISRSGPVDTSDISRARNSGLSTVLLGGSGQYALWPGHLAVPAGWRSVYGPAPVAACRSEVRGRWADSLAPGARSTDARAADSWAVAEFAPLAALNGARRPGPPPGDGGRPPLGVPELFRRRAARDPDAVAVIAEDGEIGYGELDSRSDRLALRLRELGVRAGTVVPVCLERGVAMVGALLAVLKAGGAFLSLDPAHPDRRLRQLVEDARARFVVTSAEQVLRFRTCSVSPLFAEEHLVPAAGPGPVDVSAPGDLAYLMYTSGTTGSPKGVLVGHGPLALSLARAAAAYRLTAADRVLQLAALGFDTSVEQIFTPLISGATLVLGGRRTWAPTELLARLPELGVTVADLTPAYWHQFLRMAEHGGPRASGLRLLVVGGDSLRSDDCRTSLRLLPGTRLVNAYGLTETVITSTLCEITDDLLAPEPAPVPIGTPLPGSRVYVLDEGLRPVADGEQGEVFIGGRVLARGYWRRPELTAELFLPDPFAPEPGARMYRTGDTGRRRPDGRLELFGRTDQQVKVLGFRVDPGEVESALAAHPAVGRARVVATGRPEGGRVLTAYFTLHSPARADTFHRGVRAYLSARLPEHMVPAAFVHVDRIPTEDDGKELVRPARPEPARGGSGTAVEAGLAHLWSELLGVEQVGPDDDFFALGGNSLIAMEMLARARILFGIGVTQIRFLTRSLLHHPTLRAFAEVTRSARTGTPGEASQPVDFVAEAALGVPVRQGDGPAPRWREPAEILLTGATGFCGAHLLNTLLATTGARIHCLVRAPDEERGLERIRAAQRRFLRREPATDRVVPLVGDLTEPMLGLTRERFEELAARVDVIHHCGGQVNFIYPYQDLRAANVGGTREVLRLAGHARAIPVHYVSSMAVMAGFGPAGVPLVTEDTPLGHPDLLSVGYVESKWVAEALLHNAAAAGLPVAVHRADDVTGDLATGAMNTGTEVCAMIKFIAESGVCPDVELWLDFVPADRFAEAVAHIAGRVPAAGEVYHLTNPRHALLAELADRLRARGYPVEQLPYRAWVHRLVRFAAGHPTHPMTAFVPLFVDRCSGADLSISEMYFRPTLPLFSRTRAERALRGSGIEFPPVDAELLDLYLDDLLAVGFLEPPGPGD
ncbi:amino acid adenylation domain-containing protein [Kitasatospora sp. NPDC057015]|uniref:amino acid adenylation domain-containing protein n=1 Tax=Kitasatospora sp. NPDC057015 TaxID=3346001 RepID=UPI0036409A55